MSDVGGCVKLKVKGSNKKLILDIDGEIKPDQWDAFVEALKDLTKKFAGIKINVVK
jgi:hypothetical protein